MKAFLVPMANCPESRVTLKVAASLASSFEGTVLGCHLRPHRETDRGYSSRGLPWFENSDSDWLEACEEKASESATEQAHSAFDEVVQDAGLKLVKIRGNASGKEAVWREKVGSPDRLMAIMGPTADLSVVARPTGKGRVARMFVLAALLHSGRPVMLLPQKQKKTPGKRIAIGWNQSAEISRIISSSLPLLQKARKVTLISCGSENRLGPKSAQMKRYLGCWGVDADIENTPGKDEQKELMEAYRDTNSDLLLMGAYSRPRFHQVVFGGMTEHMLWHSRIPLIIQHF